MVGRDATLNHASEFLGKEVKTMEKEKVDDDV